jgi:2-keto-4-pentenoate hydratase/2-oxohepta-3-ene-1,7-dioic acid hydratase in catechol pathway
MKLVTYSAGGAGAQAGIVIDEQVHPLSGFGLPDSIVGLLELGDAGMSQLADASKNATGGTPLADVKLLPVIPRPTNTFLLAGNYQSHIIEDAGGKAVNKAEITPRVFMKPPTAVIGTGDPILIPEVSDTVDYELEIAAVIGKPAKNVSLADANQYIAGYMVFNDVSARGLNTVAHRKPRPLDGYNDWLIGKWCDSFAAVGPYLITSDEIPDPADLEMSLYVNGNLKQHSSAGEMIFTVPEAIEYLSKFTTILPGSLIAMGTPGGVGDATGTYLQAGDVVVAEIEKLGRLENPVK